MLKTLIKTTTASLQQHSSNPNCNKIILGTINCYNTISATLTVHQKSFLELFQQYRNQRSKKADSEALQRQVPLSYLPILFFFSVIRLCTVWFFHRQSIEET
jgi:hypothetical protein